MLEKNNHIRLTEGTVNFLIICKVDFKTFLALKSSPEQKFLNFTPSKNLNKLLVKQAVILCFVLTLMTMKIYFSVHRKTLIQSATVSINN